MARKNRTPEENARRGKSENCCKSQSITKQPSPEDFVSPAIIAASFPKFREKWIPFTDISLDDSEEIMSQDLSFEPSSTNRIS